MSNIIVCYKWVIDEADIRINPDLTIDFSQAKCKISEYDRNAIETGMQCAGENDIVVSLTYGDEDARKSLKDALSRGPAKGYLINDPNQRISDGAKTAQVLASALRKIGDYKLVICGEGAADTYAHEIGPRVGVLLDLPVITNVISLTINGNKLEAVRKLNDCMETVEAELPAVITVLPEIYQAPIPGLKMVMNASRKPTEILAIEDLDLDQNQIVTDSNKAELKGYAEERKNILFDSGSIEEKVQQLVHSLNNEGVL